MRLPTATNATTGPPCPPRLDAGTALRGWAQVPRGHPENAYPARRECEEPERVGVLGPGGVGAALAFHLSRAGFEVVCVAKPDTANAIDQAGITLDWQGQTATAQTSGATALDSPVELLLVTVKEPDLDAALGRVELRAVERAVIVPLMNGLEHVARIRSRFPGRVAAGSIGLLEVYKTDATHVVQTTAHPVVSIASDDLGADELTYTAELLRRCGVAVRLGKSEKIVLWEKAVRLAPLAALTTLTQRSIGEVRSDPKWRPLLDSGIAEGCAVATADGAPMTLEEQLAIIDRIGADATTSTARDSASGRPSELDAIVGAVIRAGERLRVPTPTLANLLARCRAS